MNLLLISKDFDNPEVVPFRRHILLVKEWIKRGNLCTIITVRDKDFNGLPKFIPVLKLNKIFYFKNRFKIRLVSELLLMINVILKGFSVKEIDAIFVSSPPFLFLLSGYALSYLKRVPLIVEIRDAYPDIAIEVGLINNVILIRTLKFIEKLIYKRANVIITTCQAMKYLISHRTNNTKVVVIDNIPVGLNNVWMHTGQKNKSMLFLERRKKNGVNILSSGNLGQASNNVMLILAAKRLQKHHDLVFHIIGEGIEKELIKSLIHKHQLNNVYLYPALGIRHLIDVLNIIDIGLIALKNYPCLSYAIPARTLDYLNYGIPVVFSGNGALKDLLTESKSGLSCSVDKVEEFASLILALYSNKILRRELGSNGKTYMENIMREKDLPTQYHTVLNNINN